MADQDRTSVIFHRASDCADAFHRSTTIGLIEEGDTLQTRIEELRARFNLWTAYVGALAPAKVSLDARLAVHHDVRQLVLDLLSMVLRNLKTGYDAPRASDVAKGSETVNRPPSTGLDAVASALDRLHTLATIIRRSTAPRSNIVSATVARAEPVAENCRRLIEHRYRTARRSLTIHLGNSIDARGQRLAYMLRHDTKVGRRPNCVVNMPAGLPAGQAEHQRNDVDRIHDPIKVTQVPMSETNVSFVDSGKLQSMIQRHKPTLSTISRGVPLRGDNAEHPIYPHMPKFAAGENWSLCPICSEPLSRVTLSPESWRSHIDRDLEPYVCLSEECQEPLKFFASYRQWREHMMARHSISWAEKVHTFTWYCDCQPSDTKIFESKEQYQEHLAKNHKRPPNKSQVLARLRKMKVSAPRESFACPLCDCVPAELHEVIHTKPYESLFKHIASHLKSLAFLSLSFVADDVELESQSSASISNMVSNRRASSEELSVGSGQSATTSIHISSTRDVDGDPDSVAAALALSDLEGLTFDEPSSVEHAYEDWSYLPEKVLPDTAEQAEKLTRSFQVLANDANSDKPHGSTQTPPNTRIIPPSSSDLNPSNLSYQPKSNTDPSPSEQRSASGPYEPLLPSRILPRIETDVQVRPILEEIPHEDPLYRDPGAPQPFRDISPAITFLEPADVILRRQKEKHPAIYQCTLCPKKFTRAYNLRSHMRTHTEERPYVCTVCGKAFARQHDRKRHEGLHSGEKKFVCKGMLKTGQQWGCNRRFVRADALGRHFRSEAGRECIKPLLDEEYEERQRNAVVHQETLPVYQAAYPQATEQAGPQLPTAILEMYPALTAFNMSTPPEINIDFAPPSRGHPSPGGIPPEVNIDFAPPSRQYHSRGRSPPEITIDFASPRPSRFSPAHTPPEVDVDFAPPPPRHTYDMITQAQPVHFGHSEDLRMEPSMGQPSASIPTHFRRHSTQDGNSREDISWETPEYQKSSWRYYDNSYPATTGPALRDNISTMPSGLGRPTDYDIENQESANTGTYVDQDGLNTSARNADSPQSWTSAATNLEQLPLSARQGPEQFKDSSAMRQVRKTVMDSYLDRAENESNTRDVHYSREHTGVHETVPGRENEPAGRGEAKSRPGTSSRKSVPAFSFVTAINPEQFKDKALRRQVRRTVMNTYLQKAQDDPSTTDVRVLGKHTQKAQAPSATSMPPEPSDLVEHPQKVTRDDSNVDTQQPDGEEIKKFTDRDEPRGDARL